MSLAEEYAKWRTILSEAEIDEERTRAKTKDADVSDTLQYNIKVTCADCQTRR